MRMNLALWTSFLSFFAMAASGLTYAEVCVYEHEDFRGGRKCFDRDVDDLAQLGINDQISSLKIHGDLEVTLYRDGGYRGRSLYLDRDARRLEDGFNDSVSSIKIRPREHHAGWGRSDSSGWEDSRRYSPGRACLYRDSHYQGQEVCFDRDEADFAHFQFDNQADSIRIEGDIEAILYEHHDYRGYSRVFRNDEPDFRGRDHDQFSSIRIRPR